MLLQSGASRTEIQALCRWQTDESINIYARLDASRYASYLNAAMRANVTTTTGRAQNLRSVIPFINVRKIPSWPPPLSPDEWLDSLNDGKRPTQPLPRRFNLVPEALPALRCLLALSRRLGRRGLVALVAAAGPLPREPKPPPLPAVFRKPRPASVRSKTPSQPILLNT